MGAAEFRRFSSQLLPDGCSLHLPTGVSNRLKKSYLFQKDTERNSEKREKVGRVSSLISHRET